MYESLKKAISFSPELAKEIDDEDDFKPYKDLPEFKRIVNMR